jgi:hypothetical protein
MTILGGMELDVPGLLGSGLGAGFLVHPPTKAMAVTANMIKTKIAIHLE